MTRGSKPHPRGGFSVLSAALGCPLKAEAKSTALDEKHWSGPEHITWNETPKFCCWGTLEKQNKESVICKGFQGKKA